MTDPRQQLPDLDPAAAALLAAYRRGRAMPPAARARVWDRIDRPAPSGHVLKDMYSRAAWAAAFALAAALALWFARRAPTAAERASAPATLSPDRPATPEPAQTTRGKAGLTGTATAVDALAPEAATSAAADARTDSSARTGDAKAPGSAAAAASEPRTRAPARSRDPAAPRPAPVTAPDEPAPAVSDLRAEQLLLARGWQALADGRPAEARRDADEHARRFPAGVLEPERRALAAAAACADDRERGRALARVFLADHPRSPLARRLRDACSLDP